jgi:hypothetical protein
MPDSPATSDHLQPLYRSRWLKLGELEAQLVAHGFSAAESETQIIDIVRDGVLPGGTGDGLRIRIAGNDNPWFARSGLWLRERPALDFESSTIRVPVRCEAPGGSITEDTFAMLRTGLRAEWTLEWLPIEILREDFERLLNDETRTEPAETADGPEEFIGTGAEGRPSSWHLVEAVCRRLYEAGRRHPNDATGIESPSKWAEVLHRWWLENKPPKAPPLELSTIRRRVGELLPLLRQDLSSK